MRFLTEVDGDSWRLSLDTFRLPSSSSVSTGRHNGRSRLSRYFQNPKEEHKVSEYYKKQEKLLEGFNEMETINETDFVSGAPTEEELKRLAKSERFAVHISNIANLVLFVAKVYASVKSRSMAVIASTLDSLLDLLSGFILWFTAKAMRKPNHFHYPIGKRRMQPVGIIVFASVMATLGLHVLLESTKLLISKVLATTVLAVKFYWWIDPSGAIVIALYTISIWARTVVENVHLLTG